MRTVPNNKHDLAATEALAQASDDLVENHVSELLKWLQDMNWPVADPICQRLKLLGTPLVAPIKWILSGEDEIWKYWILERLLPEANEVAIEGLRADLLRISNTPTPGEAEEELHILARDLLL